MPASYTHYYVATKAFAALPKGLQSVAAALPDAYYFGAQGADLCFFIPVPKSGQQNFGRFLHRAGGYGFFRKLAEFSKRDRAIFAYALGYITHYAADVALHPYVYFLSGSSKLKHARVEGAIDKFLSRERQGADVASFLRSLKPPQDRLSNIFNVYAAYAAELSDRPFTKRAFYRAATLFNAYTVSSFRFYQYAKPPMEKRKLYNTDHGLWRYPAAPERRSSDGVSELLNGAISESVRLAEAFSIGVNEETAPARELFGKNYISGLL